MDVTLRNNKGEVLYPQIKGAPATQGVPAPIVLNPQLFLRNIGVHRGLTSYNENTIEAFEQAWKKGYKYMECDVQVSSDGRAFLQHDNTTIFNSSRPLLKDMLLWAKKRQAVIELDCAERNWGASQFKIVYDLICQYKMQHSCIIVARQNELQYLINQGLYDVPVCVSLRTTSVSAVNDVPDTFKSFPYTMVSVGEAYLSDTSIPFACHAKGYGCKVWTVTTQERASQLFNYGADIILCDVNDYWDV